MAGEIGKLSVRWRAQPQPGGGVEVGGGRMLGARERGEAGEGRRVAGRSLGAHDRNLERRDDGLEQGGGGGTESCKRSGGLLGGRVWIALLGAGEGGLGDEGRIRTQVTEGVVLPVAAVEKAWGKRGPCWPW